MGSRLWWLGRRPTVGLQLAATENFNVIFVRVDGLLYLCSPCDLIRWYFQIGRAIFWIAATCASHTQSQFMYHNLSPIWLAPFFSLAQLRGESGFT